MRLCLGRWEDEWSPLSHRTARWSNAPIHASKVRTLVSKAKMRKIHEIVYSSSLSLIIFWFQWLLAVAMTPGQCLQSSTRIPMLHMRMVLNFTTHARLGSNTSAVTITRRVHPVEHGKEPLSTAQVFAIIWSILKNVACFVHTSKVFFISWLWRFMPLMINLFSVCRPTFPMYVISCKSHNLL